MPRPRRRPARLPIALAAASWAAAGCLAEPGDAPSGQGGTPADPRPALPSSPSPSEAAADRHGPVAQVATCGAVEAFAPCRLSAAGSHDPDGGDLVSYAWAVTGGARPPPLAEVDFAFDAPGTFRVELTVTDRRGMTATAEATVEVSPAPPRRWAVAVFMNGDNNLEQAALDDLAEMEAAPPNPDVLVLAQLDRAPGYAEEDGAFTGARRYAVGAGSDPRGSGTAVLDDLGEVDMGDPQTVAAFGEWAVARVDAERWFLVFWDHGDGWTAGADGGALPGPGPLRRGISRDETSGSSLSVASGELAQALAPVASALGRPLDLLGFDACIMQMYEVGFAAAPYASYLVASEDYERVDGWPYDAWLSDLAARSDRDAVELGEAIAARHVESGDATLSVVDLATWEAVGAALDGLAGAGLAADDGGRDALRDAFDDATAYDWSTVDLGDLAARAAGSADPAVAAAALDLGEAVDRSVVAEHHAAWRPGSTGLAVYVPLAGTPSDDYAAAPWSESSRWDELLRALYED